MLLPSVTIDIVGQHYKKRARGLTLKKSQLHAHSIHTAGKYSADGARRILFF